MVEMKLAKCRVRSWREGDAHLLATHANNRRVWINLRDRFPHSFTIVHARTFIQAALAGAPETRFAIDVDEAAVGGRLIETFLD